MLQSRKKESKEKNWEAKGARLGGLVIMSCAPQLLPVPDPWITSKTFKDLKGVKQSILSPGPSVYIPQKLSPPSLDKNYIIAVCDLL